MKGLFWQGEFFFKQKSFNNRFPPLFIQGKNCQTNCYDFSFSLIAMSVFIIIISLQLALRREKAEA